MFSLMDLLLPLIISENCTTHAPVAVTKTYETPVNIRAKHDFNGENHESHAYF